MRIFGWITAVIAAVSILYRWRYKIINSLLAISVLRKSLVKLMMSMPRLRTTAISNLFNSSDQTSSIKGK